MLKLSPPAPRQRAWSPLAISAAAHLAVVLTAAGLTRHRVEAVPEARDSEEAASRRVEMIYIPPAAPATPAAPAQPRRLSPPPPPVRRVPEPEPNAPPEAERKTGRESDNERPLAEPAAKPRTAPTRAAKNTAATMESEARRIFGRPRLATRAGAGPQAVRPMEAWMPENPGRCVPRQPEPSDTAAPRELGTVVGRIFRQDNGRPLAGAHLQMVGTPYVAFTDGSGEYRFRFDAALMDNCRTQYVKVTAAGYESRLLVLVLGPQRSEDVHLRRR